MVVNAPFKTQDSIWTQFDCYEHKSVHQDKTHYKRLASWIIKQSDMQII